MGNREEWTCVRDALWPYCVLLSVIQRPTFPLPLYNSQPGFLDTRPYSSVHRHQTSGAYVPIQTASGLRKIESSSISLRDPATFVLLGVYITLVAGCWLEVSMRKVLRPATSAEVFLGFPVSKSECWDGSQHSKLLLHASHVAFLT